MSGASGTCCSCYIYANRHFESITSGWYEGNRCDVELMCIWIGNLELMDWVWSAPLIWTVGLSNMLDYQVCFWQMLIFIPFPLCPICSISWDESLKLAILPYKPFHSQDTIEHNLSSPMSVIFWNFMVSDQDSKKKGRFFISSDHFSVEHVSDSLFSKTL